MPRADAKLSKTRTAVRWLSQFSAADLPHAVSLLDRLTLLSESDVARRVQASLDTILPAQGRVALYAEREIQEATAFPVEEYDDNGRLRERAAGNARFAAVKPRRGSRRVGSEGWIAFLISQAVKANPRFVNHPSPRQYLSAQKSNRIKVVVIVTDFIGSGDRILAMLEKFWRVPTFASWWSRGHIQFKVVAAAGTVQGIDRIEAHRSKPRVTASVIVSTLRSPGVAFWGADWLRLATVYGPAQGALGHKDTGALVAFEYGFPNNAPAILAARYTGWRPLYLGRAPSDLNSLFGLRPTIWHLLRNLAEHRAAQLRSALDFRSKQEARGRMMAFLLAVRGKWYQGAEVEIAERSGLSTEQVLEARAAALQSGWMTPQGRVTDNGRKLIRAAVRARKQESKAVVGSVFPYYPVSLRVS